MQLDFSRSRPRRWRRFLPIILAALLLALPCLVALVPAAADWADRAVGAHYAARLDALQRENFTLHQRLAESADALAENRALRQLVNSGRVAAGAVPARVLARLPGGFTLACPGAAVGQVVLDASGQYAGSVTAVKDDCCTVTFTATAGLCGAYAGLVTPGQWVLTGLPADCTLAAGDIVTTPGGDWLGALAGTPAPDANGLTARASLIDTANLWDTVYFVKK